jgi:hypothetical protein
MTSSISISLSCWATTGSDKLASIAPTVIALCLHGNLLRIALSTFTLSGHFRFSPDLGNRALNKQGQDNNVLFK